MKLTTLLFLCIGLSQAGLAQYFYKDLIVTRQTSEQLAKYQEQKIRSVKVASFENDGEPTEDFNGSLNINNGYTKMTTTLRSPLTGESELTSTFNSSKQLVQTVDTTDGSGSVSRYTYSSSGQLTSILNVSTSVGLRSEKEEHLWFYDATGKPQRMLRVKNDVDTTHIDFVIDDNGNVTEENGRRKGQALPSVYYYYDAQNRLTDIVTYNQKAKRLLPVNIFEYNDRGLLSSMLIVQEGTDDYQKWIYEYNDQGLKVRETCLNKRKQLMGKIEYQYQ